MQVEHLVEVEIKDDNFRETTTLGIMTLETYMCFCVKVGEFPVGSSSSNRTSIFFL